MSEVRVKPTKEFLQCLAENLEDLTEKISIFVVMESNKFLRTLDDLCKKEEEEYVEIEPDMSLITRLNALAPFIIVLYDTETKKDILTVKNARFCLNLDYETLRATCPFCGHEQDYVANFVPYTYPHYCKCGASVSSDFGDASDVAESLSMYAELVDADPDLFKVPFRNLLQARDKQGRDIIALQLDMDEDGDGTWLVFRQKR
jgi:hypothetical protein